MRSYNKNKQNRSTWSRCRTLDSDDIWISNHMRKVLRLPTKYFIILTDITLEVNITNVSKCWGEKRNRLISLQRHWESCCAALKEVQKYTTSPPWADGEESVRDHITMTNAKQEWGLIWGFYLSFSDSVVSSFDGVSSSYLNISVSSPLKSATSTGNPTQAGTRYSKAGWACLKVCITKMVRPRPKM